MEKDSPRESFKLVSEARRALEQVDNPQDHSLAVKQNVGPFNDYLKHFKSVLENVMEATKASSYRLYSEVPGSRGFRYDVAFTEQYKDRKDNPLQARPVYLDKLKQWCVDNLNALAFDCIETDDALCIVQTDMLKRRQKSTIAANDKDILQCQGRHFRLHAGHRDIVEVEGYGHLEYDKESKKVVGTGSKFFFSQVLTGDKTDTYSGLPKCGPANAVKALEGTSCYEEGLEVVREMYHAKYGDDFNKYLLEQARLAWMLRDTFNGKRKNVPMWDVDYIPYFG